MLLLLLLLLLIVRLLLLLMLLLLLLDPRGVGLWDILVLVREDVCLCLEHCERNATLGIYPE